jgi:type I restriction enzyme, R subunit
MRSPATLERLDLFITEKRLRQVYEQPDIDLKDFLRSILRREQLPPRGHAISQAFDEWVAQHSRLNATQLMFIRTLRQALLNRAAVRTIDQLKQSPFHRFGDPEKLFTKAEINELLELATASAA